MDSNEWFNHDETAIDAIAAPMYDAWRSGVRDIGHYGAARIMPNKRRECRAVAIRRLNETELLKRAACRMPTDDHASAPM